MEHRKFRNILAQLRNELTAAQLETLQAELADHDSGERVCALIDRRFEQDRQCPHCGHEQLQRCGRKSGLQRWKCLGCDRSFNALTGTKLARLKHKERWLGYMRALIDGLSVRKAASGSDISTNTSFRWRHRMLDAQKNAEGQGLKGIGEVDETFFRKSFKGARQLPREPKKRGEKASKRGLSKEQIPVLIARDRSGSHVDAVLSDRSRKAVKKALKGRIAADTVLCTESDPAIIAFARDEGIRCETIVASRGERSRGPFHIQNVNGYISRLKNWMRRFNGVATKYLASYLGWRRMLDLQGSRLTEEKLLISAF